MNIDNIIDLWSEDVKMDNTELDNESLKIPNLHAKWLGILTKERQKLRRLDIKKKELAKKLGDYYQGHMTEEELKDFGREPYLGKAPIKTLLHTYVDGDTEMIELTLRVSYQQEMVDTVEEIMKAINGRQWNIRNAIDWKKFTQATV